MVTNYDFFYDLPFPLGIINTLNPKFFHIFDLNEDGASCNSTEEDILTKEPHVFAEGA